MIPQHAICSGSKASRFSPTHGSYSDVSSSSFEGLSPSGAASPPPPQLQQRRQHMQEHQQHSYPLSPSPLQSLSTHTAAAAAGGAGSLHYESLSSVQRGQVPTRSRIANAASASCASPSTTCAGSSELSTGSPVRLQSCGTSTSSLLFPGALPVMSLTSPHSLDAPQSRKRQPAPLVVTPAEPGSPQLSNPRDGTALSTVQESPVAATEVREGVVAHAQRSTEATPPVRPPPKQPQNGSVWGSPNSALPQNTIHRPRKMNSPAVRNSASPLGSTAGSCDAGKGILSHRTRDGIHKQRMLSSPPPPSPPPPSPPPCSSSGSFASSVTLGTSGTMGDGATDAGTIMSRRRGENSSPALSRSLEKRVSGTTASLPYRAVPPESTSWLQEPSASPSAPTVPTAPTAKPRLLQTDRRGAASRHPSEMSASPSSLSEVAALKSPSRISQPTTHSVGEGSCTNQDQQAPIPVRSMREEGSPRSSKDLTTSLISRAKPSTGEHSGEQQQPPSTTTLSATPGRQSPPAMYGVIDLSCGRCDAGGSKNVVNTPPPVSGGAVAQRNGAVPSPAPANRSFKATAAVKLSATSATSQQRQTGSRAAIMSPRHTDPTAVIASHSNRDSGKAGVSEVTTRHGATIVRMGCEAHATVKRFSASSSAHTATAMVSTSETTITGSTVVVSSVSANAPLAVSRSSTSINGTPSSPIGSSESFAHSGSTIHPDGSVVVPPNFLAVASGTVATAQAWDTATTPVTLVTRLQAVRIPARTTANVTVLERSSSTHPTTSPKLSVETVLPVADLEAGYASSATETATLSSSSAQAPLAATAPSVLHSADPEALAGKTATKETGSSSGMVQKPRVDRRVNTSNSTATTAAHHEVQRRDKLAATYTSGGAHPANGEATAVCNRATSAGGGSKGAASETRSRRNMSVSPSPSDSASRASTPAMNLHSFASSRQVMQRYVDQWRERYQEDKSAYKEGGYLTVIPGRLVHGRYVLIQKLGWGEFSTVWLGYDTKHATLGRGPAQAFVAVKVAKCLPSMREATEYEVSLLRYLEARLPSHVVFTNIIDCFDVRGDFGLHNCIVMPLCGPNLLSIINPMKAERGRRSAEDVRMIKEIVLSLLLALHELSLLNVLHTDIKPENVLCSAVDSRLSGIMEKFCNFNEGRSNIITAQSLKDSMSSQANHHLVCLADFGLSVLLEPPGAVASWASPCDNLDTSRLAPLMRTKPHFSVSRPGVMENTCGTQIQTREYRAPEVLLGLDFTCATDVWSVGCMVYELLTGMFLMDPKKRTRDERAMDIEHLAMMMQLIGPLPPEITNIRVRENAYYEGLARGAPPKKSRQQSVPEYLHYFVDREGKFMYASRYRSYPRRNLEMELETYLNFREARLAADFILSCLFSYDPTLRPSAKKMLAHPWLRGVGATPK